MRIGEQVKLSNAGMRFGDSGSVGEIINRQVRPGTSKASYEVEWSRAVNLSAGPWWSARYLRRANETGR